MYSAPTVGRDEDYAGPMPSINEVLACQFSSWYDVFANISPLQSEVLEKHENAEEDPSGFQLPSLARKNVTIPSVIIHDLPSSFKEYLLEDGIRLPTNTRLSSCADIKMKSPDCVDNDDDWSSSSEHTEKDDTLHRQVNSEKEFNYTHLNEQIIDCLRKPPFLKVQGAALPKLNWSAPRDATWIHGGSMKCTTPGDVYLLLKASDFCLHDVLNHTLKECSDYKVPESVQQLDKEDENYSNASSQCTDCTAPPPLQLVLRKWCNLHPSMEFRCFVRQHTLIAISQRHHSQHFPHLKKDWPSIRDTIEVFFEDYVCQRYADGAIGNYVMDVYLDQKDRVWIVDFNCWSFTTDALLFDWSELVTKDQDSIEEDPPEMRIVNTDHQVRQDPLASYRAPIDTVNLATITQGDAKQFEEFMKLCQHPDAIDC